MNKDPVILLSLGSTLYEYSSIHNVDCVDVTFLFTGKNDPSLLSTKIPSTHCVKILNLRTSPLSSSFLRCKPQVFNNEKFSLLLIIELYLYLLSFLET